MKYAVIGASGYLGSELLNQAQLSGYEAVGSYNTNAVPHMFKLSVDDESTWRNLANQEPDIVVWSVWSDQDNSQHYRRLISKLVGAKHVYISSDVTFCQATLGSDSRLGNYARAKQNEHQAFEDNGALVLVPGPIYGVNSAGIEDSRTTNVREQLKEGQKVEFWEDVFKTFTDVSQLAKVAINHTNKQGVYSVGDPKKRSYYQFYLDRLPEYSENIVPGTIKDVDLATLGICRSLDLKLESLS